MGKSICIFHDETLEKNPRGGGKTDFPRLKNRFFEAGFEVIGADRFGLTGILRDKKPSVLLIDSESAFPSEAVEPLKAYCREGGKLITIGGYAFYKIVSDSFESDGVRRCISVSSKEKTTACFELCLTDESEELGGPMAGIFGNVKGFSGFDSGETMVVKFWMKSENVEGGGGAVHLRFFKGDELLLDRPMSASGEGWQYVFGRVPTPLGTDKITISAGLDNSSGKASFDSLHIGVDHYTRVYDCDFEGDLSGWERKGEAEFKVEPREKEYYLSSAFADNVEDFAFFRSDSIPLFDLEAEIKDAVSITPAPDQTFFGENAVLKGDFSGWSAITVTGDESARLQPLLLCRDRAGVLRGYAGALVRCFKEGVRPERADLNCWGIENTSWRDYPGFSAAFFGITSADIFESDELLTGLVKTAEALAETPYIAKIQNRYDCYRTNERAEISGVVSSPDFSGRVRLLLIDEEGETVETAEKEIGGSFGFCFETTDFKDDFYKITCELFGNDGTLLDKMSTGFVVWQEKTIANGPRLTLKNNFYYIDHGEGTQEKAVFATGVDDLASRTRTGAVSPLALKGEFIRRRDLGICVYEALDNVRNFPKNPEARERHLRGHDAVVALACKYDQIYMMGLAIGDNIACSDEQIAESAFGIRAAAERYRNNRNIIYYLNGDFYCRLNEETIPVLEPVFNRFLKERYPTDEALSEAWGERVTRASARLEGNWPDGKCYSDRKAQDYNFFRYYLQNRWITPLTEAVHGVDKTLPCTSEYYETPKFSVDLPRSINNHDISNIGCFSHFSEFSQRLAYADQRFSGKGFGIGEYGKRGHELYRYTDCEYMRYFPQNEVLDTTAHYLNGAYAMGANHCHLWCYIDLPDANFPWGIIRADNAPRDLAYWVRNLNFMTRQNEAVDMPCETALILPDNTRSAASRKYQGGHYAAIKAISTLQHLCGRLMTLNECNLVIPKEVRVIFYPVAFNPPQRVFDMLCDWVKEGGTLYVSGDISGDGDFFGKSAVGGLVEGRLEKLLSIRALKRNYTGLDFPKERISYSIEGETERRGLPHLNAEIIDKERTTAVASTKNGGGVIFKSSFGKGQVVFNSDPSEAFFCGETIAEDKALYRYVMKLSGVDFSEPVSSDVEDVKIFELPLKDGGRVVNFSNVSEKSGEFAFEGKNVFEQRPLRAQTLRENGKGEVTGLLCEGKYSRNGRLIVENNAYAYILSCDKKALSESLRVAVLPQGSGLVSIADSKAEILISGQVEEGKFVEISRKHIKNVRFEVEEAERNCVFLLCAEGDEEAFEAEVEKTIINSVK